MRNLVIKPCGGKLVHFAKFFLKLVSFAKDRDPPTFAQVSLRFYTRVKEFRVNRKLTRLGEPYSLRGFVETGQVIDLKRKYLVSIG
jgi:hypothetical protein